MKNFKKIGLGLVLLAMLLAVFLIYPKQSSAANPTTPTSLKAVQDCVNSMAFTDLAHITCTTSNNTITFTDSKPDDGTKSYTAGTASSDFLCSSGRDDTISFDLNNHGGMLKISDAGKTLLANVTIFYIGSGSQGCVEYDSPKAVSIKNTNNVDIWLAGGKDSASSLPNVNDGHLSGHNFTRLDGGADDSPGGQALYGENVDLSNCSGNILAVNSAGNQALEYPLANSGTLFSDIPALSAFPTSSCRVDTGKLDFTLDNQKFGIGPAIQDMSVNLTGRTCDPTKDAPPGYKCSCTHDEGGGQACTYQSDGTLAQGGTGSTVTADNSCEAQYTGAAHEFSWAFCPLLRGIDSLFSSIYSEIQAQLTVCTGPTSSTSGAKQDCNNLLTPQVEKTWSIFREIASALLVIVMLIMVFSQAVSAGPLDAYTVRKMLPRLVAAVILIQISWFMLKFFIDLSNDLGKGVQDLMLVPFGGPSKLSFDSQVSALGSWAPATLDVGLFTAVVAASLFSGLTIFGVLIMGVTAAASVIVGFLVLLIRQMLILLAVILAPIAFIAFILPGTQRYWKLWYDNFSKLLLMFPLIMGMIAAGQIFAHVGVSATNASSGSSEILGLVIVLVGFLFPLWYLPKAFKWGGQLFASAANGAWGATKGLRNRPSKYALEMAKHNREDRAIQGAERLANNRGRFYDPLLRGRANLALSRRARRDRFQDTLEKGRKTADEQAQRAVIGGAYEQLNHEDKVRADILVAQGRVDDQFGTGLDGREAAQQRAALERLAKYGDWDAISLIREAGFTGEEGERVWQKFVAAHIGEIHQNVPHLSPQRTDLSRIAYGEFRGAKDFEFDELLRQAMQYTVRDANTGQLVHVPAGQEASKRAAHIQQAQEALQDTQFMASIGEHGRQTLELIAHLPQNTPEVQINRDRQGRMVGITLPSRAQLLDPSQQTLALSSLTAHLVSPDPATSQGTRNALVAQLSDPSMDPVLRGIYETHLATMRTNAAGDPNGTIGSTYNQVITDLNTQLATRPDQAERTEAARPGSTAASVAAARQNAANAVGAELARLRAASLTLIP